MSKLKVSTKIETVIEKVFIYCFMLYAALGSNVITYGKFIISIVMWPTFMLGLVIILYKVINYKEYIKMPAIWCLVGLLGSIGISVLANIGPSFKQNVVFCLHWAYCFLILYLINQNKPIETVRKDMELMMKVFVAYTVVCIIGGILFMVLGINGRVVTEDTGYEYFYGFKIGRLFGVFISANNGAMTSAVAIAVLIYFICRYKKVLVTILCSLAIVLCVFYIALSDSRTGAVCTGVSVAVFFGIMYLYKQEKKSLIKKLFAIVIVAVIGVIGYMIPRLIKDSYNEIITSVNESNVTEDPFAVDRGYDLTDDVSNRRFDVWGGAVELYLDSPKTIAIGTSFKEFTIYAKQHQPQNYLVNNDYTDFNTLDNEIFNIMVSQGTLGLIAFAALLFVVIKHFVKNFYKVKEEYRLLVSGITAGVVTLTAAAMFVSVMFYHTSPNTMFFWVMLGGLVYILKHGSKEFINE